MTIQNIRGTFDILPDKSYIWEWIENRTIDLYRRYNYQNLRTPIFEYTELFQRTIGEGTDIVSKEMYSFLDKKNRSLTLRPEGTAPIVRSCIQNKLIEPNTIYKIYYFGPMFRYERPQAGRQRQFHQTGIEILGSLNPEADVEAILLLQEFFHNLGIKNICFRINSTGSKEHRPYLCNKLKEYITPHLKNLCEDCLKRYEKNILRIYDCKVKSCKSIIETLPGINTLLTKEDNDYFDKVKNGLKVCGIEYEIDNKLVRGLDYYTHTIFEAYSKDINSDALAGGGRYDNLFKELGSSIVVPAVGFGVGIERVINILKESNKLPSRSTPDIMVMNVSKDDIMENLNLANKLRENGFVAEVDLLSKNLKAQFKIANRNNIKIAIIKGEEEKVKNVYKLKNLIDRSEKEVNQNDIFDVLKKELELIKNT